MPQDTHYTFPPNGEVVLTRTEISEGDDPVLVPFLGFLAQLEALAQLVEALKQKYALGCIKKNANKIYFSLLLTTIPRVSGAWSIM